MPQSIPFFMYGTSAAVPDLFHCTRFEAPDPVCAVKWPDGSVTLLVGDMEFGRARNQTRGIEVVSPGSLAASSARAGRGGLGARFQQRHIRDVLTDHEGTSQRLSV